MNDTPTRGQRERLASIHRFDQLVAYLRDELDWPISRDSFDDVDDLFYEFSPEELGIDPKSAAKIESIKRLRPLSSDQPWGIFFVKFEPRRLPIVALRRLLGAVALKKRTSANPADRQAWAADDLLFVSNYGEDEERRISFAHFTPGVQATDLPTLKVLGWDGQDTALHLDQVANTLHRHLTWPEDGGDLKEWRSRWRSAFRLRHRETITTAEKLSVRLAQLARDIRDRIGTVLAVESKRGPLRKLLEAFQQSLVGDLDEDGFADMYAQTIAYGLLSARIVDPEHRTTEDFAGHMRTSPFLRELMESFIKLGGRERTEGGAGLDFDELGVSEVVELLDEANMEAVVADFGRRKQGEDPVIHFYEHFLTEYDKQEKVSRGVFYTPRPVVSYIVRSVDELLRSEFGLVDGLADTTTWGEVVERHPDLEIPEGTSPDQAFIQILDPATGTGTFLVEVIEIVHATMMEKWKSEGVRSEKALIQRWNEYVPTHLLPRLHGYELMMAPYAIAHLKIGIKLYETGYRFESEERARIYLTNALEPAQDFSGQFEFTVPALAHEAQAVNTVKEKMRLTVVIGNPPYSKSSQNQSPWINDLMEDYKGTVRGAETQIQSLSDDYSKFLRAAHFFLEESSAGVLGFITNNGYLDGPLFRDMRHSMSTFFKNIQILNLHGDSRKKLSPPEGKADENVFDIQQGVAIGLMCRGAKKVTPSVHYAELWGTREERYETLAAGCIKNIEAIELQLSRPFYLFIPVQRDLEAEFQAGWHVYDIFGTGNHVVDDHISYGAGFVTQQDTFAVGFSPEELAANVRDFLSPVAKDEDLWRRFRFCSTKQWNFNRAKRELKDVDILAQTRRILYRPFDFRYTVFDRNICTIIRARITKQLSRCNLALLTTRRVTRLPFDNIFVTNCPAEYKVASHDRNTIVFPLWISGADRVPKNTLFDGDRRLNINESALRALASRLGLKQNHETGLPVGVAPEEIFHYAYAIFHSPCYRNRYGEFLKIDFPRLHLTGRLELFRALAQLGAELTELHLLESPQLTKSLAKFIGGGKSEVEKVSWSKKTVWIDKAQTCGFKGVPEEVWNFHIGGYQVCQKWLKDRQAKGGKNPRPGRVLTDEDIAHYQKIIVAISATIRIMGEIDEVIEEHGGWPGAFQVDEDEQDAVPLRQAAEEKGEFGTED